MKTFKKVMLSLRTAVKNLLTKLGIKLDNDKELKKKLIDASNNAFSAGLGNLIMDGPRAGTLIIIGAVLRVISYFVGNNESSTEDSADKSDS